MNRLKKIILKRYRYFVPVFLILIFCGCGTNKLILNDSPENDYKSDGRMDVTNEDEISGLILDEEDGAKKASGYIVVFVCGAVKNEGVYELEEDMRIDDALKAAGGFAEYADTNAVNLAEKIYDGQRIYFPLEGESYQECGDMQEGFPVNINTADSEKLQTLPGIGKSKAEGIIEYRNTHGDFENKEDIKNVSGIGDSIYLKIEKDITVNDK